MPGEDLDLDFDTDIDAEFGHLTQPQHAGALSGDGAAEDSDEAPPIDLDNLAPIDLDNLDDFGPPIDLDNLTLDMEGTDSDGSDGGEGEGGGALSGLSVRARCHSPSTVRPSCPRNSRVLFFVLCVGAFCGERFSRAICAVYSMTAGADCPRAV
jgi:hypothetical protein